MRVGFSLIELMIVLAILSVILGISGALLRGESRDTQVKAAAEELAAVLRQTRNRAMHEKAAYAVAFHIQNAPDTSGAALNNWSGGHWYRVIGPSTYGYLEHHLGGGGANSRSLPLPGAVRSSSSNGWITRNFPHFLEQSRMSWIGEPQVLPARKVRFLALGDTDEGQRNTRSGSSSTAASQTHYGKGGETTYPRPWFGYFDPVSQRLHPWGGYDPTKAYSGFFYEGNDGPVNGSRHPANRSYNEDFNGDGAFANVDRNGDGDYDDFYERERDYPIYRVGEPRPLVNADWLDAAIMFVPTGEAIYLEWTRGRWAYAAWQQPAGTSAANGNGVRDRSRQGKRPQDYWGEFSGGGDIMNEVVHFDRHTGGYHITLAPDARQDGDTFPDARSALDSILPAYRVYVGRSGAVRVLRVQRRGDGYLDGHTVWPPTPTTWNAAGTGSGNPIWQRCRLGYLHEVNSSTSYTFVPTGRPITSVVTERMLTERIWWFDE